MCQTQHSPSGYYYFSVPYWLFFSLIGWLVWNLNLIRAKKKKKSFERGRHFLTLCWWHRATFPCTRQQFKKTCGLLSSTQSWSLESDLRCLNSWVYSAIKARFDLDFQAVTALRLCILLWIVPPLYRFFQLTLLILFEEAVWGQLIAWRNTRPEEQQL